MGRVVAIDLSIAWIAAGQKGLITWEQLIGLGVGPDGVKSRVRTGRLFRVRRGVYSLSPSLTPFAAELAAVLACGYGAVLSHRSAAAVWGLLRPGDTIHVTVPDRRRRELEGVRVHRPRTNVRRVTRHGLPITTVEQTLKDIASTEPIAELERALNETRVNGLASQARLLSLAESSANTPGARNLRAALHGQRDGFTRSQAERELKRLVEDAGLPRPHFNATLAGRERDAVWRDERLVVEVDGYAAHAGRDAFERDRRRDAELAARGWRVVRITWRQLTGESAKTIARLARALYASP